MLVGTAVAAASPAWAEDPPPRCFKVRSQRGSIERICESAHVVTIESGATEGDGPSVEAARAHAVQRWDRPADIGSGAPPVAASDRVEWSGLRVGLGPWGALSHPAASSGPGLVGRIGYDVVPVDAPSFVVGLMAEQAFHPAMPREAGAAERAVTDVNLRFGTILWGRIMPYLTAGLASSTRTLALGGGSDVGAGLVYAVDERWSVSLDYRHIDLTVRDTAPGSAVPGRSTGPVTIDSVAASLNCKIL